MAVNFVDNAATQEANMALTQGAVTLNANDLIPGDKEAEKMRTQKSAQELTASQLIEKGKGKSFTTNVLKPFFGKLAEAGITLTAQNKGKISSQIEKMAGEAESYEDMVEIRNKPEMIRQIRKLGQQGGHGSGSSFSGNSSQQEVIAMLKEYAATLTQYVANESPALADKLKDLRAKLLKKGISEGKLKGLEAQVRSGRKTDIAELVKESFVMQVLSGDNTIEKTVHKRRIANLLRGMDPGKAKQLVEKAKFNAAQELKDFTLEELENELIKITHLQDGDFDDALELMRMAKKAGVNASSWLEEVWETKKDNHGLNILDVPHSVNGSLVDTNTDNPSDQQRHGYEYEEKDEKEVLLNRLRALYMQRAFKGDGYTFLKTEFKVRKLKNGLFKLGIFTKDMEEQVQHEAEVAAKIKIIEMLKEALIERASFYDLAGPAHELVERKIKGLLKNAERLGMPISASEFNSMRDTANRRIFELSIKELKDVRTRRITKDAKKLEKKEMLLLKLLVRLKEESSIEESIPKSC